MMFPILILFLPLTQLQTQTLCVKRYKNVIKKLGRLSCHVQKKQDPLT